MRFIIEMHIKDQPLLEALQLFFKAGIISISKGGRSSVRFEVSKFSDIISIIIPHFRAYPLQSTKRFSFIIWAMCADVISRKDHLTLSGL